MTSSYGPSGRNEPQGWGQQPVPSYPTAYPNPYATGLGEPAPQEMLDVAAQDGEPPRRTGLIWTAVVVVVVAIAGFVVLGYVWAPWTAGGRGFLVNTVFDSTALDAGVAGILRDDYGYGGLQASDVSCPANQAVKQGGSFSCTVTINGGTKTVPIKVTSDDGNYEVYRPQ